MGATNRPGDCHLTTYLFYLFIEYLSGICWIINWKFGLQIGNDYKFGLSISNYRFPITDLQIGNYRLQIITNIKRNVQQSKYDLYCIIRMLGKDII